MLWLPVGTIEPAHEIVQDGVTPLEREGLSAVAKSLGFVQGSLFTPADFVTAHERLSSQSKIASEQAIAFERIAWFEWESL